MSNNLFLNWAIIAVSLFNTILLTWLGLTVLLNSDRRVWGIWLATAGLLLGAMFFVSHTAVVGLGLAKLSWWSMVFWWAAGMIPAIILPFAWYFVMLWYGGYWNIPPSPLRIRQRRWFISIVILLAISLICLGVGIVLLTFPTPALNPLRAFIRWSVAGIPLLAFGYSVYVLSCIGLSIDTLRQPGGSRRMMGTMARRRARPWLAGASVLLLVVSLMVVGVMLWIVQDARQRTFLDIYLGATTTFAWLDLVVSSLIGLAIVFIGQAVVSYEVFTGKTLPRRGLLRHWRRTISLAAGYGTLVGATIAIELRPLYALLITTILMTFFYALVSWRSYEEREKHIAHLRPFVSSQRLVEQLLTQTAPQNVDFVTPFHALCADVLDAELAYLVALGPIAPLVGAPLVYSDGNKTLPPLKDLTVLFGSPETMMVPLEPAHYGGAIWGIPLWSERGLIGVFLLGEKIGNSLYTQEEIEIARVIGERLIDTRASAEMARRLMTLQRERLAQSQIVDQQTRRVLHDDILPGLQASMIALSSESIQVNGQVADALKLMTDAHKQISDLLHDMPTTTVPEVARLGLIRALQQSVDIELAHAFDEITWQIEPEAPEHAATIPTLTAEVIFYAAREIVRNAARHARDTKLGRPLHLCLTITWQEGLVIQIEDDGIGLGNASYLDQESGHGLALHSTMMAVVGGAIAIESNPDQFTRVILSLPQHALTLTGQ